MTYSECIHAILGLDGYPGKELNQYQNASFAYYKITFSFKKWSKLAVWICM